MNSFLANLFSSDGGSARRFIIGVPAIAVLALNNKLGLGLDTVTQGYICTVAVAMIAGSNLKDALIGAVGAHADGKVAAAKVEAGGAPDDVVVPTPKPTV